MFTRGSKSDKLNECFDLFDHNHTGDLSKRTFQRYLSAILTVLMQWTEDQWTDEVSRFVVFALFIDLESFCCFVFFLVCFALFIDLVTDQVQPLSRTSSCTAATAATTRLR